MSVSFSSLASFVLLAHVLNFSLRDGIDTLIVAFLVYVVLSLLRETRSVSVVSGVLTLCALYGIALIFDLQVTAAIFRLFFSTFLIILAVVFQRELRRLFSFFSFSGARGRLRPVKMESLDIISGAVWRMARHKTGALIVLPGREPLDRLTEGGHVLDGTISEPLLLSIFDDHSPGHDGAVIVEQSQLKRFGVHLPLSDHLERLKGLGLRHRAALGMSERSDALIIVVSEEKGKVRLVRQGKFFVMASEEELNAQLRKFEQGKFPEYSRSLVMDWVSQNLTLIILSIVIAWILWLFVHFRPLIH